MLAPRCSHYQPTRRRPVLLLLSLWFSHLQQQHLGVAEANFDRYAGYLPLTQITDEAAIDLDQLTINEQLYDRKNNNAMQVYKRGGHSGSFAVLRLINLEGNQTYPAGTKVIARSSGDGSDGSMVEGFLQSDISWDATTSSMAATEATVNVTYQTQDSQANYGGCQVGALYEFEEANRAGCFPDADGSTMVRFVNSENSSFFLFDDVYEYEYDQRVDNRNSRTLQGLSLTAKDRFMVAGQYFDEFQKFVNYYWEYEYADRWITSADQQAFTNFKSG